MIIIANLNEKTLKKELRDLGFKAEEIKREISETKTNNFLWFKMGAYIITYDATKRQKWTLLYK